MCQNFKSFRVGLVLAMCLAFTWTLSLPTANAGRTPTAPNVTYEMWLPRTLPMAGNYFVLGMNNLGDVLVSCFKDYVHTVFIWNTLSNEWVNVSDTVINSPDLRVVASGDLDRARGTAPWSAVLDPWIAPEENHNNLNDVRQIAGSVWFERSDGVPTGSHACRWTPGEGNNPPELILFDVEGASGRTINNLGDVAGFAGPGDGVRPYLWRVVDKDIPILEALDCADGRSVGEYNRAYSVNDDGVVTGQVVTGSIRAFRYTPPSVDFPASFEDLGLLPAGGASVGLAINNFGQVAGMATATTTGKKHAFLCTDRMVDLGTLGQGSLSSQAYDINDRGHVVGFADISSKAYSMFLYTPGTGMYDLWKLVVLKDSRLVGKGVTVNNIVRPTASNMPCINDPLGQTFGQICGCIRVSGVNDGIQVPFILMPKAR